MPKIPQNLGSIRQPRSRASSKLNCQRKAPRITSNRFTISGLQTQAAQRIILIAPRSTQLARRRRREAASGFQGRSRANQRFHGIHGYLSIMATSWPHRKPVKGQRRTTIADQRYNHSAAFCPSRLFSTAARAPLPPIPVSYTHLTLPTKRIV